VGSVFEGERLSLQLLDVSRVHLYAPSVCEVYVQLLEEGPQLQNPSLCSRLLRTMYGALDAADEWSRHYTSVLCAAGFRQGVAGPCHLWHPGSDTWVLVHGDVFFSIAGPDGATLFA